MKIYDKKGSYVNSAKFKYFYNKYTDDIFLLSNIKYIVKRSNRTTL